MLMVYGNKFGSKRPKKKPTATEKLSFIYHVNKIMHFKLTGKTTSDGVFNWPAEEGQAI